MQEHWRAWMVAGLVLAILEVVLPVCIFAGFAVAAALTVFALVSVAAWAALRALSGTNLGEVKRWNRDINDNWVPGALGCLRRRIHRSACQTRAEPMGIAVWKWMRKRAKPPHSASLCAS